jgi:hypothetical protein
MKFSRKKDHRNISKQCSLSAFFCILLSVELLFATAFAEEQQQLPPVPISMRRGTVCYPPYWAGIVVGFTIDRDAVALHGKGFFTKELGHLGGRYYVDEKRSVTMVMEIGVNHVIDSVKVQRGSLNPKGPGSSRLIPISKRIDPKEGFGIWRRLHLGSTSNEVRENLGDPAEIKKNSEHSETWTYYTDYKDTDCYADSEVTIGFLNGEIYSIRFYNGE